MGGAKLSKTDKDEINLDILDKVFKTISVSSNRVGYNRNGTDVCYQPVLERGNIVKCEFIGIGKELKDSHYGIVWSAPNNNENLNLIPLTSKFKKESVQIFDIGCIPNFITLDDTGNYINKNSYVYINKMMEVSRKRIKLFYQKDAHGNMIKIVKNGKQYNAPVQTTDQQLRRVMEGIKLFYGEKQETLIDIIKKQHMSYFCDVGNEEIFKLGFRLVEKYVVHRIKNNIVIIFYIDGNRYSLTLWKMNDSNWNTYKSTAHKGLYNKIEYSNTLISRRTNVLEGLFEREEEKVDESIKIIKNIFGIT